MFDSHWGREFKDLCWAWCNGSPLDCDSRGNGSIPFVQPRFMIHFLLGVLVGFIGNIFINVVADLITYKILNRKK